MSQTTDLRPGRTGHRVASVVLRPLEVLARGALDLDIVGRHQVPEGSMVVAANHYSFIDPVLVSVAVQSHVRYLAVGGIFERSPWFARLITFLGAIPLPAGRVPVAALREALREVEAGHPVGVFPEGRRVSTWGESDPRHGAAWLSMATGVPLLPVAIVGTHATLSVDHPGIHRTAVRLVIHPPLDPMVHLDAEDPVGSLTEAWRSAVDETLVAWAPIVP